ncbi:MAG: hypothetical protein GX134_10925 [candidate division WS1 bacterium]|nr:hypothetical protein [candidate division WS1 bacterium]
MTEDQRAACVEAIASLRTGRPEDVPDRVAPFLRGDSSFVEGWQLLGISMARLGRDSEGLEALLRATSLSDVPANAHHNLGVMHLRRGEWEAAHASFAAALAADPALAESHRGLFAAEQGRPAEASAQDGPEFLAEPDDRAAVHTDPQVSVQGVLIVIPFLMPTLPSLPPTPPPRADAFGAPLGPRICLSVAVDALRACPGDAGLIGLVFVGALAGMYALDWAISVVLQSVGLDMAAAVPRAGFVVVALLISAGMALVGVMLADTQLYGMNTPSVDDLWGGFEDWGVVAGTSFVKAFAVLIWVGVLSSVALMLPGPWLQGGLLLASLPPLLYLATRFWFPVHLMMTTEREIGDAYRESWDLTRVYWKPLLALHLILNALLCIPVAPLVVARSFTLEPLAQAGLHVAALVIALFVIPLVAAAVGTAYRLSYVRRYPGATPIDWQEAEE